MDFQIIKVPRQTGSVNLPQIEIERYLREIQNCFGRDFLTHESCSHRLQQLWERTDSNSTIELLSLGCALETLRKTHPNWLKRCIKDIKGIDSPKLNGPLFELMMLSWLINGEMEVTPSPYGYPGIDLRIQLRKEREILVSLKSFDISEKEKSFRRRCEDIRSQSRDIFKTRGHKGIHIFLTAKEYIGSEDDWVQVRKILEQWPPKSTTATLTRPSHPNLELGIFPFTRSTEELSADFFSDDLLAMMPWHKDEKSHFMRKINNAIEDLHSKTKDQTTQLKACFIRIHQTANILTLKNLALEIVSDRNSGIDLILLFQPAYIQDPEEDTTTPALHVLLVGSEKWNQENERLKFQFLIGSPRQTASKLKFKIGERIVDLPEEYYYYNIGQHFIEKEFSEHIEFNLKRQPNLPIYPVVHGKPIAGIFAQNDEFSIL